MTPSSLGVITTLCGVASLSFSHSFSCVRAKFIAAAFSERTLLFRKRMASSVSSSLSPEVLEVASVRDKITSPCGSWKSPITADVVSGAAKRLGGTAVDGNGRLILLESRPTEQGRGVLVKEIENLEKEPVDITPKEFAVRTTAQEYGGGAFKVFGDTVIFSNYKDQRLYKQSTSDGGSSPVALTPDYGGPVVSYADGFFDSRFHRYITVQEDRRESSLNPATTIVSVALGNDDVQGKNYLDGAASIPFYLRRGLRVLISGSDFYAFPRVDPKGERIAWIEWHHPNMPWDKSELWVGYISETGEVYKRVCVAGHDPACVESPTEPKWSSEGELFFITDRQTGFWNLYKWNEANNEIIAVYSLDAEFSGPSWVFGMHSYEVLHSNGRNNLIACSYRQNGRSYLGIIDDANSTFSPLDIPFTDIDNITLGTHCIFVEGASSTYPPSIAKVTLDEQSLRAVDFKIIWSSSPDCLKYESYFSVPELIEFPTEIEGQNAYAYFYPPSNPLYQSSPEEKPPFFVEKPWYGGPTAETRGMLNLAIQYWTSRGWAIVDVNYGGSTGYGREYRERLLRRWGIVDVNDCCSCAKFLVNTGKVDGNRLCITGGSAGGYTTLAALSFRETFKAGASLYGVADLRMLRAETHKFESHYIDNLVGGDKDYFERAPINFVHKFSCPIILFQGLDDKVVPPEQARKIYKALKENGLPVALVEYEGEQHGFRKAENIKFTLEQQMVFFARLVGNFTVADEITPIKIDNFD